MRFAWISIALLTIAAGPRFAWSADSVDYARQVKPLLEKHCYACHGALQQKGGLRVDTVLMLKKGAESGEVFVAGAATKSRLIEVVTRMGDIKMPPEGEGTPLTAEEVQLLRQWIDAGATGPADEKPQADPRDWWSYQLPVRANTPAVKHPEWVRNPIDAFIAARHDELGLVPVPAADRATWLRRAHIDLVGLPPTRDELKKFLADSSTDAYEQVVDDLLQRPQYGERWGRHWMDVWRYSDWYGSRGINEIRYSQRHIWRWRDWIVDSLNTDKPYDRMIVEMLAADEVAPTDPGSLAATGFIGRNWYKFDRNVWMFDLVEHTGQAFLALTLKCCRCHDHKYDPISQEEYYRFRAFFEPHDVRTDRLDPATGTEKDATLGEVLKDGVARVFDKQVDAKTFLFQRGDNRYPDESRPLTAGVPAALQGKLSSIKAVSLPVEAYYPALQPKIVDGLFEQVRSKTERFEKDIVSAREKFSQVEARLAEIRSRSDQPGHSGFLYRDNFLSARPEDWKVASGEWVHEKERLVQKTVTSFATMVLQKTLPQDVRIKLRYRPLAAGTIRSIGFSFDYIDSGNSQDVYTHTGNTSQTVQAFHRYGGQQVYPQSGIVTTKDLKVGEEATIEITAQGQQLAIWLNGNRRLDYVMPVARRAGKFALWVHDGSAEFLDLEIRELLPTLESLERERQIARQQIDLLELTPRFVELEANSLRCRIEAERSRYFERTENRADFACYAERSVAELKAAEELLKAEFNLIGVRPSFENDPSRIVFTPFLETAVGRRQVPGTTEVADAALYENSPAALEAEQKVAAARKAFEAAQAAVKNRDGKYTPIGEVFPTTSTGRRTALAQWIASRQNPRTARVAVNHIWMRHFGQALVPSVSNFGLNGDQPSHPELLDWLAVELMDSGWKMKAIHRLIVLSHTYRMSSAATSTDHADSNSERDPTNRFLWRMNSRRMEAEVVRDSVLFAAGSLDPTRGGPEIPEAQGQSSLRRSLYFRNTPNEKMKFLELFDMADPNGCYRRRESVVPQQALALMNSALALDQARLLAEKLTKEVGEADDPATSTAFVNAAFETVLGYSPTSDELNVSLRFLRDHQEASPGNPAVFPAGGQTQRGPSAIPRQRARENFVHVLFSHNGFVTVR